MQISRHWRMNATRYRLEGVRYGDGTVAIQDRNRIADEETDKVALDSVSPIRTNTDKPWCITSQIAANNLAARLKV